MSASRFREILAQSRVRLKAVGITARIPEKRIRFSEKNMRQRRNLARHAVDAQFPLD